MSDCVHVHMYVVAVHANYHIAYIIKDFITTTSDTTSLLLYFHARPFPLPLPPSLSLTSSPLLSLTSIPKGIIVGVPSPCPADQTVQDAIESALKEASKLGIKGSKITPFVLSAIEKITKGTLRYLRLCLSSV